MKPLFSLAIAFSLAAPAAFAQQPQQPQQPEELPPPIPPQLRQQAAPQQGPLLVAPQPAKNPGKPPEFFKARRAALIARKEAQKDRMRQVKAARAAAEEKAYQDWHERYLADTPVRVEYYRALARAYEADAALAYTTPYYYSAAPPIILPVIIPAYVPIYEPLYYGPTYGTVYWGW